MYNYIVQIYTYIDKVYTNTNLHRKRKFIYPVQALPRIVPCYFLP